MKDKETLYRSLEKIAEITNEGRLPEFIMDALNVSDSVRHMSKLAAERRNSSAALLAIRCMMQSQEKTLSTVLEEISTIRDTACDAVAEPEAIEMPFEREGDLMQDILDALLPAVRLTRAGAYVEALTLEQDKETVNIIFSTGYTKRANVAGDSGIEMIRDVCGALK